MNNERYTRQMLVSGIGEEGQKELQNARILVVGAGGLGSPVLQYLAGAGIGTIGIVDADVVSVSNLHRQILHPAQNVGMNKAESAKQGMLRINDEVNIVTYPYLLTEENAFEIVSDYDFVIDCVDNFRAKFLINDVCVVLKKPFCHAGVLAMHGQVKTYVPGEGPCFRCIFEEIPEDGSVPTSVDVGILGAMAGMIGCVQALEAIKYFTGVGELLTRKMYVFDAVTMKTRMVPISEPSEFCRVCGPEGDIRDVDSLKAYYAGL